MNDNTYTPQWTRDIREGNFAAAEEALLNGAATRAATQMRIQQAQEAIEGGNPFVDYVRPMAQQRLFAEVQQGKLGGTVDHAMQRYGQIFNEESQKFKNLVRPGYERSQYSPSIPSDAEVRDYVAERRASQERLKEEGRRLPNLVGGR